MDRSRSNSHLVAVLLLVMASSSLTGCKPTDLLSKLQAQAGSSAGAGNLPGAQKTAPQSETPKSPDAGGTAGSTPSAGGSLGKSDSSEATAQLSKGKASGREFRVKATAEGLIGGRTATGAIIQKWSEGAALPSRKALGRRLQVTYIKNGAAAAAKVGDVGPWNTRDPYWEKPDGRPHAESGRDTRGRRTNRAGIDLYNATWYRLLKLRSYDKRLIENTSGMVSWKFLG